MSFLLHLNFKEKYIYGFKQNINTVGELNYNRKACIYKAIVSVTVNTGQWYSQLKELFVKLYILNLCNKTHKSFLKTFIFM